MQFNTLEEKEALMDAFFSAADNVGENAPVTDLLGDMKKFMSKYGQNLVDMKEALCDSVGEAFLVESGIIGLEMTSNSKEDISKMITTDNVQLNKVTLVFATLCKEMTYLTKQASLTFYGPLTMFGQVCHDVKQEESEQAATESETPEYQMGSFLPFLQDLSNFVERVTSVLRNCIHQLACLYHGRQKLYLTTFKHVKLQFVFENLAALCCVLYTLDEIITQNIEISNKWAAYKRMIKYVRAKPDQYDITDHKLFKFQQLMVELDSKIISGNIFNTFISSEFGLPNTTEGGNGDNTSANANVNSRALVAGNRVLSDEFKYMIIKLFDSIDLSIGKPVETYNRLKVVECYCLYALYRRIFISTLKPDHSMYRKLWSLQNKVPIVPLYGSIVFFIAEFIVKYAPLQVSRLSPDVKKVVQTRVNILKKLDDTFAASTHSLYLHMSMWMVRIESELISSDTHTLVSILNARSKLVLNGILLANQIKNQLIVYLFLHTSLQAPFPSKNIRQISICMEMLKSIEFIYNNRLVLLGENISQLATQTCYTLKRIFSPVKKKFEEFAQLDDTKLDAYAAIKVTLDCLSKDPCHDRLMVLNVSTSISQMKNLFRKNHLDEIEYQLWKLKLLTNFQSELKIITDCSFIYWHQNLASAFFKDIYKHPEHVYRLPYLFSALNDANNLLSQVPLLNSQRDGSEPMKIKFMKTYRNEIYQDLTEYILSPLCREVETDLRLHIHSVVLEQANLRASKVRDLSYFLSMIPIKFFDIYLNVKEYVTHELNTIFYNLATVALHDWRIYAEMRNLAKEKYGLDMQEVYLPGTSHYSEALDILQIMRKIHIFVGRYVYNMNTQIFMERAFDQRHVNTINVSHISQSIRSHGVGIMNTTVNFTYQFLCRKFMIFSEFLYDDHIKSRLMKDIRWFNSNKEELDLKYPYHHAEKFTKLIRKLGVTKDGLTFLDQFRIQITEIGNALGYVRMVRSGGLKYLSNAIQFVPDLNNIPNFSESLKKSNNNNDDNDVVMNDMLVSPETVKAAKNLDDVLDNLKVNLAEGTEYFQILVNIFQNVFQTEEHKHLKLFYIIVPPLTLNFVEQLIARKDKVHKKGGRDEASFTDDGFALGLAYILRLLDQTSDFDSLHWFDSVRLHVNAKKEEITLAKKKSKKSKQDNDEDLQHMLITTKRLESIQSEFELLEYSFSGARIFFRTQKGVQEEKKPESEQQQQQDNDEDEQEDYSSAPAAAVDNTPAPVGNVPPPPGPPPAPPL